MTQITLFVVSLSTLLAWKINRPVEGMRLFSLGLLGFCAGSLVGLAHHAIPSGILVILANALIVAGLVGGLQGVRQLRQFPVYSPRGIALFMLPVMAGVIYFTSIHVSYGGRVIVVSTAIALLTMDASFSMIRGVPAEDRALYWPTGFAFVFATLFVLIRIAAAFLGYYDHDNPSMTPIEIPMTICANLAYVACGFGMLLVANAKLRHAAEEMASFDPLTGLPNRRVLLDRLLEAEQRAMHNGWQLGVIYLDLDDFKAVNDTYGHQVGDELLKSVSAAMTPMLGPGDCLARLGGDEFVVVVEDVEGREELNILAQRLKSAVEGRRVPVSGGGHIKTSCGVGLFPDDGESAHDVMREADSAMYRAKRHSRAVGQQASA